MDKPLALCDAFRLQALRPGQIAAPERLEQALRARWEEGRAAWPKVELPVEVFAGHLGACLGEEEDPERFVQGVQADELYLACACAQGIPAALLAFDQQFLRKVPPALSRIDPSPSFADEILQVLRERLLVAPPGGRPKIAEFSGQGALRGWLRIVAVRTAHNLRRNRDERPVESVSALAAKAVPAGRGAELDYIRARHQKDFKDALRAAFATLPPEQRNVVRWHFVDGLTGDKIAGLLGVSRRTVVRWLGEAREALLAETRRQLRERLRLSDSEFDSLMGLVRSDIDLSISMFLGE